MEYLSLSRTPFLLTGSTADPRNIDYDIFGLHKKRTIVKGELTKVEYYKEFDGVTYNQLVVEEDREYTRDANLLVQYRTQTSKWFLEDNSIGIEKVTVKYYSPLEAIDEGVARRENMLGTSKLIILASCGLANGLALLDILKDEIVLFRNGKTDTLRNAITASTEPYLTTEIKAAVIEELTY